VGQSAFKAKGPLPFAGENLAQRARHHSAFGDLDNAAIRLEIVIGTRTQPTPVPRRLGRQRLEPQPTRPEEPLNNVSEDRAGSTQ
jgi:hypothetical protein